MAAEHYNRVVRLLDEEKTVELEVKVRFHEEDTRDFNTVASLQGTDLAEEIVMLGDHLDSWHGGSGATDNAAGSSVVLEGIRILKAVSAEPR
jgi:carboxypeptidase Q